MERNLLKFLFLLIIPVFFAIFLGFKKDSYCANSISCIKNLNVNIENDSIGIFNGQKIMPPKIDLNKDKKVLGESSSNGDKHIYVDLTKQILYAYEGNTLFLQTLVSTGKWHLTPTGEFKIWTKLRATRMTGGTGADYYDLPNVPYVMFFGNNEIPASVGFSLHGAYWHNNFGHPMSHGCVNMRITDAERIYNWIPDPKDNPTLVTIYGKAPL